MGDGHLESKGKPEIRLDRSLVEILRQTRRLEIYFIEPVATLLKDLFRTYRCGTALLRADEKLLRVEGTVEDFGCRRDEAFALALRRGWFNFECKRDRSTTTIVPGALVSSFEQMSNDHFVKYDHLASRTGLEVAIIEQGEEMRRDNGEHFIVTKDTAIIMRDAKKSILIIQDMFPYNLLVSQDLTLIDKVMGSG